MNRNNKQSDREILEEILMILRNLKASPVVVQPSMKVYNNKEVMELLGVKDKYLKKLRDNGYLGFSREGDKYWYTQKDVDCFLHSFHYEPFNSDKKLIMDSLDYKYKHASKQKRIIALQDNRQMPTQQIQKMDDRGPG